MYGVESNLTHKMEIGETKHKIEVGLRYHYDQIRRFQNGRNHVHSRCKWLLTSAVLTHKVGDDGNVIAGYLRNNLECFRMQYKMENSLSLRVSGLEYINSGITNNDERHQKTLDHSEAQGARDWMVLVGGGSVKYDMFDDAE